MKITGPGQIQPKTIKKASSKPSAGGANFSEQVSASDGAGSATGVTGAAPLASVDALWALQEVPDSTTGRSKGLMRADDMLDILEEVRKGILLGSISMPNLRALADLARNQQGNTDDKQLDELLQEIELRAEVELAKYEV